VNRVQVVGRVHFFVAVRVRHGIADQAGAHVVNFGSERLVVERACPPKRICIRVVIVVIFIVSVQIGMTEMSGAVVEMIQVGDVLGFELAPEHATRGAVLEQGHKVLLEARIREYVNEDV
jgi:hypothetical protein